MSENKNEYKLILRISLIVVLISLTVTTIGIVISQYNKRNTEVVNVPSELNVSGKFKTLYFDFSSNHAANKKEAKEILETYFENFSLEEHGIILSQTVNENHIYESTYFVVPKEQMDRDYSDDLDVIEALVITSFELFTITPKEIEKFQRTMVGDDELGNEEQDQGLANPDVAPPTTSPETAPTPPSEIPPLTETPPTPNPEEIPTPEPIPDWDEEEEILLLKEVGYKIDDDKLIIQFTSTKDLSLKVLNKANISIRYYNKSGELIKSQNKMVKDYLTNTETNEVLGKGDLVQAGTYQTTVNNFMMSDIYRVEVELTDQAGKSNKVHLEISQNKFDEAISLIENMKVELIDSVLQVQFTTLKDVSLKIKDKGNVVVNYYDDTAKLIQSSNKKMNNYLENTATNELYGKKNTLPSGTYMAKGTPLTIEEVAVVEIIVTDNEGNSDTKRTRVYTEELPLVSDVQFEKSATELILNFTTTQDISLKLFEKGNITINYLGESGEIIKSCNKWQMDYLKSVNNQYYGFGKVVPPGTYSAVLEDKDVNLISKVEVIVKDGLGNEGTKVLEIN
ncbi:MAG: hypothetical protein ACRCS6_00900 [Turicibacter sp.]